MRYIVLTLFAFVMLSMNAQTSEQKEILKEIEGTYQVDDDFGYSYVRVLEDLNATKEEIHARALSFFHIWLKEHTMQEKSFSTKVQKKA